MTQRKITDYQPDANNPNAQENLLEYQIELVPIDSLKPHPRNYRNHPDDQLAHIIESIREHGLYQNIVTAQDLTILAHHGVWMACQKLGYQQVPIKRVNVDPEDPRAIKILIGDNEIEHLAMQDDRLLSELLKEINELDIDGLLGTGFDESMLAAFVMVTRPKNEISDFNAAAHWVGMPEYNEADSSEPFKLIISFRNEQERERLMQLIAVEKPLATNALTWSIWWPPRERDDLSSVRFESND